MSSRIYGNIFFRDASVGWRVFLHVSLQSRIYYRFFKIVKLTFDYTRLITDQILSIVLLIHFTEFISLNKYYILISFYCDYVCV